MSENVAERRATPREPVVENRVCVEWWAGNGIRRTEGRMLNISSGGALIVTDDPPPLGQPVWFHVEAPARTDDVGAQVVRHSTANEVGLAFSQPCPYDLYLTAVIGVNPCGVLAAH